MYEVPDDKNRRLDELRKHFDLFLSEYGRFKQKNRKVAGGNAKKALTVVKKLITAVRRDIQGDIDKIHRGKQYFYGDEIGTVQPMEDVREHRLEMLEKAQNIAKIEGNVGIGLDTPNLRMDVV